jgi:hypothetical protein
MPVGKKFTYGMLMLRNESSDVAILTRVSLLHASAGLEIKGEVVLPLSHFKGALPSAAYEFPPKNLATRVVPLPGYRMDKGDVAVFIGMRVERPGVYSFDSLRVDYLVDGKRFFTTFSETFQVCAPLSAYRGGCPVMSPTPVKS